MTDNKVLVDAVEQGLLLQDPSAAQRIILNAMESGYKIRSVDASNPWTLQLEASVTTGTGIVDGYRNIERRLYPANALSYDDLYRHMSDQDYITAFSRPSESRVDIYLRKDEVLQSSVPIGNAGGRRLIIPKNSTINAGDYSLLIFNQINIDVTQNNGLRITWDLGDVSPLKPLSSNEVQWDIRKNTEHEYIRIRIPVNQATHTTSSLAVSASSGFSHHYSFTDQYYYTRVFHWRNNRWVELVTTHTEQVYDINKPTAVIKVFDTSLQVVIPTVYFTAGLIGSEIRVDIYSTRGDVKVAINEYDSGQFSAKFVDFDIDDSVYINAYNNLPTKFIMAVDPLSGGSNRMSFEDLRELVIMNATGPQSLPITTAQLQRTAQNNGYDIVKNIDNITNRVYVATRDINPDLSVVDGFSPLPVTMSTLISTFNDLLQSSTVTLSNTADRITILPTTLYKKTNGITKIVSDPEKTLLQNMPQDQLLFTVNSNTYLFSPYYYVLDTGENRFRTRVYDLDSPVISVKNFVDTNPTTGIEVSVANYSIEKIPEGYRLLLLTDSNDLFKEIIEDDPGRFNCQLSFDPVDGGARTYINASVLKDSLDEVIVDETGEFFIEFILETQYDITEINGLYLTNFSTISGTPGIFAAGLTQLFNIAYIVDDVQVPGQEPSDIDLLINDSFLDPSAINHVGVTHDQITLKFGDHLKYLWTRSRTSVAPDSYMKYTADVPLYYQTNVFKYTDAGVIEVIWDTVSETFKNTILHYAGDPVIETPTISEDVIEAVLGDDVIKTTVPVFSSSDVGKHVIIPGGSTVGNGRLITTISEYISSTEIKIADPLGDDLPDGSTIIFGDVTLSHSAGDLVLDVEGNPISDLLSRDLDRETDILMFDGAYYFSTSESTVRYKNVVKNDITRWVTTDIHDLSLSLLEQTMIFFHPKQMIGDIDVKTPDNTTSRLEAKQSLLVNIYVDTNTYKNPELRTAIEQTISQAINTEIKKQSISLDTMTRNLLAIVGNNVKSIKINNLFANKEYIVTLKDASYQFSIGKQVIGLSNGTIAVKDAINYQFFIHDTE